MTRPSWFDYIRVMSVTKLGSKQPPEYFVAFGPRNLCMPLESERNAERLAERIKDWLLIMMESEERRSQPDATGTP
jgi:hypothetical protein